MNHFGDCDLKYLKPFVNKIIKMVIGPVCKREFLRQQFFRRNERSVEYSFLFHHLSHLCPTTVLDVGSGLSPLPQLIRLCGFIVTAIDNVRDFWPEGMINRHYYIIDDDIRNPKIKKSFDFITCISVLEHIREHEKAVKSIFSLLKPGGHLVMTFPYNEKKYIENVYDLPDSSYGKDYSFICQSYSRAELNRWLEGGEAEILKQEYWQFFSGEFWTCGEQLEPPKKVNKEEKHHLTCLLLRKKEG